jgi:hypothetical protein
MSERYRITYTDDGKPRMYDYNTNEPLSWTDMERQLNTYEHTITRMNCWRKQTMYTEWIPVDEKLPPWEEDVLVWFGYHVRYEITRLKFQDRRGWHWDSEYSHHITHWMPLPDPPMEASDETDTSY